MGVFLLVRRKGLEPPTYWFVASHSIQLSYRRVLCLYIIAQPFFSVNIKNIELTDLF